MTGFPLKEDRKAKETSMFFTRYFSYETRHELSFSCHVEDLIMICIFELRILVVFLVSTFYAFVYVSDCTKTEVIPARFLAS